ncbi:Inositol-pentakisphosphate 2-kinase [Fulvia fulva]|uniref:Inositol-pentakisphosphate 2-kinase n=1 Tax=Passalora fulva TaxID=5499 RepID=A0A9Q8P9A6_PASFU|nr:Inositol-pentakisphosphate 2-kinase [Fulvia fulva]KAK4623537.1 Inositol-pentakisphosphate 2-kinase [Fulvia fulva]KAK4625601.1 Inositol-pentakisphosphate 2-kinase [Fulvia fulva]UJO17746.1 Inositol-pentakisphosphate 2-kinase [Fulvia fulva]WPV14982.1 Inositol-pentakisphosphate 2-kinase [Fulvia fulva]WPV30475.1 Inositol-pentakisphosphate 2-kinase [Fulvia fulva]
MHAMSIPAWFVQQPPRLCASKPTAATNLPVAAKCRLEYLNEGGANFVFRVLPGDGEDLPSTLQGKLLRLRKDDPHIPSAEEQLRALRETFRPMFEAKNLLGHELVSVDAGVLYGLNEYLATVTRPPHREGDGMPKQATSGLLVTDMTPKENEVCLQLKPKWLGQSPNAPPDARRCRTCALRAYRASERIRTATDAQETCPLDLVNKNVEDRRLAVQAITPDRPICEYLLNQAQALFQQLRMCQTKLDPYGALTPLSPAAVGDLCKAMTLRDCSLFIKRSDKGIEARLGDLDLKQPEKLPRWKTIESILIKNGWYTNTESSDIRICERICVLSRG